ncbi:hypothetical protein MPSEU_000483700 [Mayamaea pseudoterrestris]|nr:hypothetical protein MPSEU_000483700 [Mayamaea pseudoterrestris]
MNLPPACLVPSLADIVAQDVGTLLQIMGTVVKTGPVQMLETARTFKCTGKKGCKSHSIATADMQLRNSTIQIPQRCPCILSTGERCGGTKLEAVEGASFFTDYQEIKLQEAAGRLRDGHIPRSLLVKLEHDLVDTKCQPGDEVVVVGSLMAQWSQQSTIPDAQCNVTTALAAHSIRVTSDNGSSAWQSGRNISSLGELEKFRNDFESYWELPESVSHPIQARDFICRSVCPQLYGLRILKLALLVTLIGGVSTDAYEHSAGLKGEQNVQASDHDEEPDSIRLNVDSSIDCPNNSAAWYGEGNNTTNRSKNNKNEQVRTRRRDQSHILFVGDAGVGKSQLLRFTKNLCPRSVMTTGVGTTSAGLTCAAVREGNGKEFSLEAGALVLADKGVCCIDEFGCIQDRDRTTIHEAMEQQTISVAKAGIVCKLNCRATIVAVMNPRDCIYDTRATLAANTGLEPPLLSRFDMIFILTESSCDMERHSKVSTYLLNQAIEGTGWQKKNLIIQRSKADASWSLEKLRAYIAIVKERFQPEMSDEAAILIERHYESCRSVMNNTLSVTVRFLESLIRLSQAHARLLFRNTVTLEDAAAVIELMESTASAHGGFDGTGSDPSKVLYQDPMTVDFTEEADLDFLCFEYRLLERYDMLNYLDEDRRAKALETLRYTAIGSDYDSNNWNANVQHPLDLAPAPLRHNTSDGWPAMSGISVIENDHGGETTTHDHYGRIQYSQANPSKRSRHY